MAKSFYKREPLGKHPPCAICMGPGRGQRAPLHLPGGVSVWLCGEHRSDDFQTRRTGRDLLASLGAVWSAAGCMTRARERALSAHRARLLAPLPTRPRPGSYG